MLFYLYELLSSWIWQFLAFRIYEGECSGFGVLIFMLFERLDRVNAVRIVCTFLKQSMVAISNTNRRKPLLILNYEKSRSKNLLLL